MNKKRTETENQKENNELILKLEQQIAVAQWIQTTAILAEAILFTRLYSFKEESNGESKVLTGIWIQTIGQLLEATGVTKQLNTTNKFTIHNAQKMAITGDLIQSIGAAIEAIGGEELLLEDGTEFIIP